MLEGDDRGRHDVELSADLGLTPVKFLENWVGQKTNRALSVRDVHNQALIQKIHELFRVYSQICEVTPRQIDQTVLMARLIKVKPLLLLHRIIFIRTVRSRLKVETIVFNISHSLLDCAFGGAHRVVVTFALIVTSVY